MGYNGSGKTTIIECLKYATAGELPPNSKGGAFIHDPKLCGEKEVLAQVKLMFKSTDATKMVCTRNLQLTVKRAGRTQKALEGSLLMIKDGDRNVLSSRVAEMDAMMPSYLGVSKAILSSVIFCHQDESLWPLSAPADLKKKFDEIFEALKYTRAIDNIKVLQKDHKAKLVIMTKDEEHAKTDKTRGEKMYKQSELLSAECDGLRVQVEDLGDRLRQAGVNADAAFQKAETLGMTVGQLAGKRIARDTKIESVNNLLQNITEMSDSDEHLEQMLTQYEERVQTYEKEMSEKTQRYRDVASEIEQVRSRVSEKERECGSYEAQKENHERQLVNREKLVKETARSHNVRGFDLDLDESQVSAFMDRISQMARTQNALFEQTRRETQEELQQAQKALNQINEQKSALNQRKESSKQASAANDKRMGTLQSELNRIRVDEGAKAALESSLLDVEARLGKMKEDMKNADWENQAESAEQELRKVDDRKEKLDAELVEGTRQAGAVARLDFLQNELKQKEQSLKTMIGAHGDEITKLVGEGWTPATIEATFQRALEQRRDHVAEAVQQRDGVQRGMEQLNYQLSTLRKDLLTKRNAFKEAAAAITETAQCAPEEYMTRIQELETERDNSKFHADANANLNSYFDSCIKYARNPQKGGCMTCGRNFVHKQEIENMVLLIEQRRTKTKLEQGDQDFELQLKEIETEMQEVKSVSSQHEEWERLKLKELPKLQDQEKVLVKKHEELVANLSGHDVTVQDREAAKQAFDAGLRNIQNIAKYDSDIAGFKMQIRELSVKHKESGISRGLEYIQEEIKLVNEESRKIKQRLTKLTNDKDRARAALNNLELETRDSKSKLSTAEYQLREKAGLHRQIAELRALSTEQREAIKAVDVELQGLGSRLAQAQAKYDETARRGAEKDRAQQTDANKLNSSLNQLKMANSEINSYLDRGGPAQLKRGRQAVEDLKKEVSRLEGDQNHLGRECKKLEEQLRNHSETKRGIADNQRYRRDLSSLRELEEQIADLETTNAEADKAAFELQGQRAQMLRNKLSSEQASVIGQLKSKDETLQSLMDDYNTEYKGAAKKYKEAHILVETTKACVEDLGRYSGALDKAIMKYHSIKMEEINRIIDELWRKTYQGTDVDTILIRSESENLKANKSYNYRVCMVKQDAEMDMRGRCSAGQKVLASIIIRLALAECFGVNCGLIALDEPTTNLDQDNIRALAAALSEIIKARRQQKNFQLIVITHDEEFLRHMGCADFTDHYWRVSRNASQKSTIQKQDVSLVVN